MGTITRTLSKTFIFLIRAYQFLISPLLGNCCRFHPSCSRYTVEALQAHGSFLGSYYAMRRILRCHPWHEGGYDPIPENK